MATPYDEPPYVLLMDSVRLFSNERINSFSIDLNTRDSLHLIHPETIERFFGESSNGLLDSNVFEVNDYANYYFFDFHEFKKWVSFSILADTESGFMELYQLSYLKQTGAVTSCERIAVYEADGGAGRDDVLEYSKNGQKLKVFTKYTFSEYLFDENSSADCHSLISDSVVSHFEFYPKNTEFTTDTIFSKLDTICH